MALVNHALAKLGGEEGNAGRLDEFEEHLAGHLAVRPGPDHQHRRARIFHCVDRLVDRFGIGGGTAHKAALQRAAVGMFVGDVFGQFDMGCAGLFLFGQTECLAHSARDIVGRGHLVGVLGDRPHHRADIEDLEPALLALLDRLLPGDHQHRHPAQLGIGRRRDEIGCPRTQRGQANAGLAGVPAIGCRHEPRALFVPGQDQPDLAGARKRIEKIKVLFSRHPKNVLTALGFETFDEQVGSLLLHATFGHWSHLP